MSPADKADKVRRALLMIAQEVDADHAARIVTALDESPEDTLARFFDIVMHGRDPQACTTAS
ncbi:hypothetical protein MARCHEWKA_02220 [Brevundimonas phage vB_BpoS-Marchewka]|uniref:Uncharacterized protein n=1 Tax=Brevundimonas phage vB_BpoS-Marchewka TaxID=2948604 RepID=A0A9E7N2M5_9CAUD|nr:hypothetical protein MARCHEWKA_02220 [Brevundimonas phage vB_BpoS-Marchewka]UTC29180.1 hypothetical protein BAMBUS_00980 [Brevundimonas phage vB_BpoS-Bambus]